MNFTLQRQVLIAFIQVLIAKSNNSILELLHPFVRVKGQLNLRELILKGHYRQLVIISSLLSKR